MSNARAVFTGFAYALLLVCIAFGFAGAGHGWVSSFFVSLAGIAVIPVSALALAWRRPLAQITCLLVAAVLDLALVLATMREGFEYVQRSLAAVPFFVVPWILMWIFWQAILIAAIIRPRFISRYVT
jgi:hypothetical protein